MELQLKAQNRDQPQLAKAVEPAVGDGGIGPHPFKDHEVAFGNVTGKGQIARQTVHRIAGRTKADAAMHRALARLTRRGQHGDPVDDANLAKLKERSIKPVVQEHMAAIAHRLDPGGQRESISADGAPVVAFCSTLS